MKFPRADVVHSVFSWRSWRRAALRTVAGLAVFSLPLVNFAQQVEVSPDTIPVKNWPVPRLTDQQAAATPNESGGAGAPLVFVAITPCRVMDTRAQGGSGKTGPFGPPSLVANQPRIVPVPSSNCGVPASAAYSMNFVS